MFVAKLKTPGGESRELNGSRAVVEGNGKLHPTDWTARRELRAFLNAERQRDGWQGIVIDADLEHEHEH